MKITVNIDTTAEEMREFLGLPNIQPLHDEMLEKIRENMEKGMVDFDPLTSMKLLFPVQAQQSMESLQKAFWDAFKKASAQQGREESKEKAAKKPEQK